MAHLHLVAANNDPGDTPAADEPTDDELWLEDIARRVETDARLLFAAAWLEILRRALTADEDEQAGA
jgi:hypothetical protein